MNTTKIRNTITLVYSMNCINCHVQTGLYYYDVELRCRHYNFNKKHCGGFSIMRGKVSMTYEEVRKYIPRPIPVGQCYYNGNPDRVVLLELAYFTPTARGTCFKFRNRMFHISGCIGHLRTTDEVADYIDKMSTAFVNDFWQYDCRIRYN